MLVYWIPKEDNTLPFNASHRVSIAAFVINHKKEVWLRRHFQCVFFWNIYKTGHISVYVF